MASPFLTFYFDSAVGCLDLSSDTFLFLGFKRVSSVLLFLWYPWVRYLLSYTWKIKWMFIKCLRHTFFPSEIWGYYPTTFLHSLSITMAKFLRLVRSFMPWMTCTSYTCIFLWFLILEVQQKYSQFHAQLYPTASH